MGIYHKQTCPICGGKLIKGYARPTVKFKCTNKCYSYWQYRVNKRNMQLIIKIFGKTYVAREYKLTKVSGKLRTIPSHIVQGIDYKEILDAINYWKENERYLVEKLIGGID